MRGAVLVVAILFAGCGRRSSVEECVGREVMRVQSAGVGSPAAGLTVPSFAALVVERCYQKAEGKG